ncbi:MAG: hypothetical protein ABI604_18590, partial [Nitrospirota bacterium]
PYSPPKERLGGYSWNRLLWEDNCVNNSILNVAWNIITQHWPHFQRLPFANAPSKFVHRFLRLTGEKGFTVA